MTMPNNANKSQWVVIAQACLHCLEKCSHRHVMDACSHTDERISSSYGKSHRVTSDPGHSPSRSGRHPILRNRRKASIPPDPGGQSPITRWHEQRQTSPSS
jgi:hypothetical protein